MPEIVKKINSFGDLYAWQEGHKLALFIYKATKGFPDDEKFGITNQMRRAAISITSNIAEGFSGRTRKDKAQFYAIALGSTTELQSQILTAKDLQYVAENEASALYAQSITVHKLINGLIKSVNRIP